MLKIDDKIEMEYSYYLDKVEYSNMGPSNNKECSIELEDFIEFRAMEKGKIKICYTRRMEFIPRVNFILEVAMAAEVKVREEYIDEIDWDNTLLDVEFERKNNQIFTNLAARSSLIISQISSVGSQVPIVTPPSLIVNVKE